MKTEFIRVKASGPFIERMFRHGTVSNTVVRDALPEGYELHHARLDSKDTVVFVFKHPDVSNGSTRDLMPEWRTDI